jgi:hypothetical protein
MKNTRSQCMRTTDLAYLPESFRKRSLLRRVLPMKAFDEFRHLQREAAFKHGPRGQNHGQLQALCYVAKSENPVRADIRHSMARRADLHWRRAAHGAEVPTADTRRAANVRTRAERRKRHARAGT